MRLLNTGAVLRAEFDHTLREAQAGDDAAFVRLWRDANPMMARYLRVAGLPDPRDAALAAWASVTGELPSFVGDEISWRGWVLASARERVRECSRGRGRGPGTRPARSVGLVGDIEPLPVTPRVEPAELRGVNDTIEALRDLPPGQGEILMLRLSGGLPVAKVAELVGSDVIAVRRSEDQAVERLGAERELIAWSLAAPALPDELADQRRALATFRDRRGAGIAAIAPRILATTPVPHADKQPTVVRSRVALLCIAAISASAMSVGGLSAAAYVDILPEGLQHVMHNTIGAPDASASTRSATHRAKDTVAPADRATTLALCRAWAAQSSQGMARQRSAAFRSLVTAAGGAGKVDAYCASAPTASSPGAGPVASQTTAPGSGRGTPRLRTTAPPRTRPAKTRAPKTGAPKTSSPMSPASNSRSSHGSSGSTARSLGQPTAHPSGATTPVNSQAAAAHPAAPTAPHSVSPTTPPPTRRPSTVVLTASRRP